jgi:hypothetical protein
MQRRARQSKPEPLADILHRFLKKRNIPHRTTDQGLLDLWRRAVGPQIAAQTFPDSLKRGSLFVRVSAPVWLHQLQFMKEEILGNLNQLSGKGDIRTLHLTIGEIPSPPADAAAKTPVDSLLYPLPARDRAMIRDSLSALQDPELREILERVMTGEVGRRRQGEKRKAPGR